MLPHAARKSHYVKSSKFTVSPAPVPFLMARSIFSLSMLAARHRSSTMRLRGFMSGSPPPIFAATVISRPNFAKNFPALGVNAAFEILDLRLHLL